MLSKFIDPLILRQSFFVASFVYGGILVAKLVYLSIRDHKNDKNL